VAEPSNVCPLCNVNPPQAKYVAENMVTESSFPDEKKKKRSLSRVFLTKQKITVADQSLSDEQKKRSLRRVFIGI